MHFKSAFLYDVCMPVCECVIQSGVWIVFVNEVYATAGKQPIYGLKTKIKRTKHITPFVHWIKRNIYAWHCTQRFMHTNSNRYMVIVVSQVNAFALTRTHLNRSIHTWIVSKSFSFPPRRKQRQWMYAVLQFSWFFFWCENTLRGNDSRRQQNDVHFELPAPSFNCTLKVCYFERISWCHKMVVVTFRKVTSKNLNDLTTAESRPELSLYDWVESKKSDKTEKT